MQREEEEKKQFYQDNCREASCIKRTSWTGEDRMNQRLREARRLKQIARVSLRPSRAIQSEAERSQFESVTLERSLSQNSSEFRKN